MLTIAIDSSGEVCALALGDESEVLAEYHFYHRMDLLRRIVPNIESLLHDCGRSPGDVEGVVTALGPGSFTGLRIGVTVAKTLAFVLQKPLAGVGTLDAMARGAGRWKPAASRSIVCPMIFARANEVYWAAFDSADCERLVDAAVSPLEEALSAVERLGDGARFLGTGARRNWETISARLGDFAALCEPWADYTRGAALLELGCKRLKTGDTDDPLSLAPLYIRKPTPVVRLETGRIDV